MIEVDISTGRVGSRKRKPPVDREKIRRKHRDAYWATKKLLAKIRREHAKDGR